MPDWFLIARAARYWRCDPWDLIERPMFWTDIASTLESEESKADEKRAKRNRRRGKRH